jgi:hypothetical protein
MKSFDPTLEGKPQLLECRPGELKVYISGWIFVDSKEFPDVLETTWLDNHAELTRMINKGKVLRTVLSQHQFYRSNGNKT